MFEPRPGDKGRLVALAALAVRCRSAVERDGYRREIHLVPEAEAPARLVLTLARLLLGMQAIGVPEDEAWRVIFKCALDSMPQLRRDVFELLRREAEALTPVLSPSARAIPLRRFGAPARI